MQFQNSKQENFISFKGTEGEVKLGALHSNNLVNFSRKFEALHNKNAHDLAEKCD